MDKGASKFQGKDVSKAIDLYYTRFASNDSNVLYTDNTIEIEGLEILNKPVFESLPQINWNEDLEIELRIHTTLSRLPKVLITIFDKEQRPVALINPLKNQHNVSSSRIVFLFKLKNLQLSKGVYNMNISFVSSTSNEPYLRVNSTMSFQVIHNEDTWPPLLFDASINFTEL
jgi:lipopolysaccharide transport system ATP-binding protein